MDLGGIIVNILLMEIAYWVWNQNKAVCISIALMILGNELMPAFPSAMGK